MAKTVIVAFNKKDSSLSDSEFLQMAEHFAKKHNVFHGIYDEGDRYRIDFYLKETVIFEDDADEWFSLMRSSDKYTMSVLIDKIYVNFYRLKT